MDLHTDTYLGERCDPIERQLGLFQVKPSLPSIIVKDFIVAPKFGIVVKSFLATER